MILRNDELAFGSFHPFVLFAYYMTIIFFTMFTNNPVLLLISLVGSGLYLVVIAMDTWRIFLYYAFILLLITLTNPLFVHSGETILFFLNDRPVTLEAFLYGGTIGLMLVTIIFWFKSYNEVMTSDKFIFLFGNISPKLSLTISMIIRYVPMFRAQTKRIHLAQKTLGLYASDSYWDKFKSGVRVFKSLISWSLETTVETAKSMRARGYGLKGRSHFSLFSFHQEDAVMLVINALFIVCIVLADKYHMISITFYPTMEKLTFHPVTIFLYCMTSLFVLLPTFIELKEQLTWRLLISKI